MKRFRRKKTWVEVKLGGKVVHRTTLKDLAKFAKSGEPTTLVDRPATGRVLIVLWKEKV